MAIWPLWNARRRSSSHATFSFSRAVENERSHSSMAVLSITFFPQAGHLGRCFCLTSAGEQCQCCTWTYVKLHLRVSKREAIRTPQPCFCDCGFIRRGSSRLGGKNIACNFRRVAQESERVSVWRSSLCEMFSVVLLPILHSHSGRLWTTRGHTRARHCCPEPSFLKLNTWVAAAALRVQGNSASVALGST